MYVVIFRAEIAGLDERYSDMASALRERAMTSFCCLDFHAVSEGNKEIALSYWPDLESIEAWRQDAEHLAAQKLGRAKWYRHFSIDIAKICHHREG